MSVIVKSPGTTFLKKVGVADSLIQSMNEAKVHLVLGFKDFSFVKEIDGGAGNKLLTKGLLPISSNALVKGLASPEMVSLSKGELEKTLQTALKSVQLIAKPENDLYASETKIVPPKDVPAKKNPWSSLPVEKAMEAMTGVTLKDALESKKKAALSAAQAEAALKEATAKKQSAMEQIKAEKWKKKTELWESKGIVHLKDATEMYQLVHGTGAGSVYVVMAINEHIRIAGRIKGGSVSIRIEGELTPTIKKALTSQGIQLKGKVKDGLGDWEYASGHFECGSVQPERVIGAVLIGCGIPFDSPMPDMKKIREHGK